MTKLFFVISILSFFFVNCYSQTDFNNYFTLQSHGDIPGDFTRNTFDKIQEDSKVRNELKGTKEKLFLKETNYAIDEILHGGMVIYGDPVTKYIEKIIDRLLEHEPELREKLKIYTIKSKIANAFSTDQGILFVTTGLIAQLSSEAQLAYILSHEISHFTQKHILETYNLASNGSSKRTNHIIKLSQHSKENELEADNLGLERYYTTGYSKDEILSTFDVLLYSYLPFDELTFPKDYFNRGLFYVPEMLFPSRKFEIKAVDDFNDANSSHPNVKKRKEATSAGIQKLANWGNIKFAFGQESFNEIRTMCRFENIRCHILDGNYGDGLYELFIMEKEHPKSMFIQRMKAQLWLNLMLLKTENIAAQAIDKTEELEGESAILHSFLKKLNMEGMISMALRQIYDLQKINDKDIEINAIYQRLITHLATNEKFKPENYSRMTFAQASREAKENTPDTSKNSLVNVTKYDRIKNKKNIDLAQNFDTSKFYLYGLWDVFSDSTFLNRYKTQKSFVENQLKEKETYNLLTRSEKRKIDRKNLSNQYHLGINEIIVVEPMILSYQNNKINYIKSEKMENNFSVAIEDAAQLSGIITHLIDSRTLLTKGTQGYNERSTLITLLNQLADKENIEIFPVDYQILQSIQQNYGTDKVMFSLVEHDYSPNISFTGLFSSILIYPALFVYVPVGLLTGSNTELNVLILNLNKGTIETGINYYFKDAPKKIQLGAHIYDIFKKFSTPRTH